MIDKLFTLGTSVLVLFAVGIALAPKAKTSDVISATTGGLANIGKTALGPYA